MCLKCLTVATPLKFQGEQVFHMEVMMYLYSIECYPTNTNRITTVYKVEKDIYQYHSEFCMRNFYTSDNIT
jgi:hypothetical protein